jgi:probable F420-dependent oxidoreductase
VTELREQLGRYGVFLGRLLQQPAAQLRRDAARIEALGYRTVWIGEAFGREPFVAAALVLAATERLVVATGIASIWSRDPVAMMNAARTLSEAWPGRFVLGIGVSHDHLVNPRGHVYAQPRAAMAAYLEAMRGSPYDGPSPREDPAVLLAALGPGMLGLASTAADGVFTYFVPHEHTNRARSNLGPRRLLAVEQAVVMARTRQAARREADGYVATYLSLDNYRRNLLGLGFSEADLAGAGSDQLFDALIGWGDDEALRGCLRGHLDRGADHVAVQVVTAAAPSGVLEGVGRLAGVIALSGSGEPGQ